MVTFLNSLNTLKEGDVIDLNGKEDFSCYYVFKRKEEILISRIHWKIINNVNICALPMVSISYLSKYNIQYLSILRDYYPFISNLYGFLMVPGSTGYRYDRGYIWDNEEQTKCMFLGDKFDFDWWFDYKLESIRIRFYISDLPRIK